MPALREHPEDIPLLAQHFLQKCSREMGKSIQIFSNEALRLLMRYSWPGNVRELENVVERATILSSGGDRIEVCDLPPGLRRLDTADVKDRNLENATREFSRKYIAATLESCGGDKKEAAKALGIGLSSLYRKLEELAMGTFRTDDKA